MLNDYILPNSLITDIMLNNYIFQNFIISSKILKYSEVNLSGTYYILTSTCMIFILIEQIANSTYIKLLLNFMFRHLNYFNQNLLHTYMLDHQFFWVIRLLQLHYIIL